MQVGVEEGVGGGNGDGGEVALGGVLYKMRQDKVGGLVGYRAGEVAEHGAIGVGDGAADLGWVFQMQGGGGVVDEVVGGVEAGE